MSKRINIVLPDTTVAILDRVPRGNRSHFISQAVVHYVTSVGKQKLKDQLKAGYQHHAAENLKIAMDWLSLEEEASLTSRKTK
jgi:metal-responsive CopG/Arc/MetJ family transcriptional regulator